MEEAVAEEQEEAEVVEEGVLALRRACTPMAAALLLAAAVGVAVVGGCMEAAMAAALGVVMGTLGTEHTALGEEEEEPVVVGVMVGWDLGRLGLGLGAPAWTEAEAGCRSLGEAV